MVNRWDAPSAIYAALRAAGPIGHPARQTLAAGLALRLAEQGHVTEVRFNVAPGTPLEAIRLALTKVTAEAAPDQRAYAPAGDGGLIQAPRLVQRTRTLWHAYRKGALGERGHVWRAAEPSRPTSATRTRTSFVLLSAGVATVTVPALARGRARQP